MNLLQSAWYWKKFYWKMFATFILTGGAAITVGLSGTNWGDMTTTQHVIFVIGVLVVVVKAQDALIDQTFQTLTNGHSNGYAAANGNGNGVAAPATAPIVQQPSK